MFPPWETKEVLRSKRNSKLKHTNTTHAQPVMELWDLAHWNVRRQVEVFPPSPKRWEQSQDEVPRAPSAATLVKLKVRPPNTFLIVGLKHRKVVFGPSGGWGIVPLTQSHSPYLHDKSWSQEELQAWGCGVFFPIYSFLYQHHFSFISGKWRNHSSNLDLV